MTTIVEPVHIELQSRPPIHDISIGDLPSSPTQVRNGRGFEENYPIVQQLAPADGGLAAWRMLISAFVFEALLWGERHFMPILSYAMLTPQAFQSLSVSSRTTTPHFRNLRTILTLLLSEPFRKVYATLGLPSLLRLPSASPDINACRSISAGLSAFSDWSLAPSRPRSVVS